MDKEIQDRGLQGWLLLSGFSKAFDSFYIYATYLPTYSCGYALNMYIERTITNITVTAIN